MAFSGLMLTTNGKVLFAKGQQGKGINYTRFAIGDGITTGSIINRTGLISEKMTVPIDAVQLVDDGTTAAIVVTISNAELATGFYLNEMGLFARDPDTLEEKLYLYDNTAEQGEFIPDMSSGIKVYERYRLLTKADNVTNITFVESGNPIYLTSLDIDDQVVSTGTLWSSSKVKSEMEKAGIPKVTTATTGNMAQFTSTGEIEDSGLKFSIYNGGLRVTYDDGL